MTTRTERIKALLELPHDERPLDPDRPERKCGRCGSKLTLGNTELASKREGAKPFYKQNEIRRCDGCDAAEERESRVRFASTLVPESFEWADFDAPELEQRTTSKRAIVAARAAISVPRVVFVGPAGSGKTSLACAALRTRYVDNGEPFMFAPAPLLSMARMRHKLGAGDPEAISEALGACVLLIDDLGMEKPGPASVNDLEMVIYERHLRARPTWVTTWMRAKEAGERYGDGIARRLFEGATIIDCGQKPGSGAEKEHGR